MATTGVGLMEERNTENSGAACFLTKTQKTSCEVLNAVVDYREV